ncbi:ABC transporter ATP-binding protein [Lancefieldella parvula]|uniref:ABC transporter ATP-binding protein n=1 Tax=Lancefieldella parvula TaxID=1382 RepID=UPI00068A7053|nr:ATP-binding cassette domain-containing protein [Lancefieldella parvula]
MSEYPSYQQNLSTSSTREEVILAIQNLSFAYALAPNSKVIEDFSCKVYAGQISLLLGPTGSGKSTILSLIKPEIAPQGKQDGSIIVCEQEVSAMTQAQSVDTIAFVPQAASRALVCETPLKELAFGLENRGVSEKEMRRRIFETVSFFGMEPLLHKRNCELSGGEQQLVALAAALVMRPKLLLLDEPTSQLDPFAQKSFTALLERVARELNVAVLVATHDVDAFEHLADACVCLGGEKPDALQADSSSRQALCPRSSAPNQASTAADNSPVLEFSAVTFAYPQSEQLVLNKCSLEVAGREIRALVGGNGSGKSTLLKLAAGILRPRRGRVYNQLQQSQGYIPQNPELLFTCQSVGEELAQWQQSGAYSDQDIQDLLKASGLLARTTYQKLMSSHPYDLSGGQQQLLALVKVMLTKARLLILDEPTKGLDAPTKEAVINLLSYAQAEGTTILVATHDMQLISRVADNVSLVFDGQISLTEPTSEFFANSWVWSAK